MSYAASPASPFAPWVLGARRRGAQLLSAPVRIERDGHALWLTTSALLSLDMDTMQEQFERQYLDALSGGDENAIELTAYNLQWLVETRDARAQMTDEDVYIALTHVPPADEELEGAYAGSLRGRRIWCSAAIIRGDWFVCRLSARCLFRRRISRFTGFFRAKTPITG